MSLNPTKRNARRRLDEQLGLLRPAKRFAVPAKGWVHTIRSAIGMSGVQFARRLKVVWQSMDDMERSEAAGTITLNSLRKAADALDCDLVYALVPRTSLEQAVNDRARQVAERDLARVGQTMALEDQASAPEEREELLKDYIREHVREKDLWNLP